MSTLVCAATFSVFTYIVPLLTLVTGVAPLALPLYLLSFGVGAVIGMQVGARIRRSQRDRGDHGRFCLSGACLRRFVVAFRSSTSAFPMMFVWGFVFYFSRGANTTTTRRQCQRGSQSHINSDAFGLQSRHCDRSFVRGGCATVWIWIRATTDVRGAVGHRRRRCDGMVCNPRSVAPIRHILTRGFLGKRSRRLRSDAPGLSSCS